MDDTASASAIGYFILNKKHCVHQTFTMKVILCVLVAVAAVSANSRAKREAYALPAGAELLIGSVKTTFACPSGAQGFYADLDNNCQIFHVCHTIDAQGDNPETRQWSFICGNQTMFNQLIMSCSMPEDAIPCADAAAFFYLNERLGQNKAVILDDDDMERAARLIPSAGMRLGEGAKAPTQPRQRG